MMMLSNQTNEGNIMARLDAVAAYDPQMAQVRLALKNNPSFIPGFVNAFNRFELGYVKMLVEDNKANIVDSISNGAAAQILRKWYSRSAGIDTKTKNAAIKEIKSILEKDGTPYSNVEIDMLSNGFKIRNTEGSINDGNMLYAAWAYQPMNNLYGGQSNAR